MRTAALYDLGLTVTFSGVYVTGSTSLWSVGGCARNHNSSSAAGSSNFSTSGDTDGRTDGRNGSAMSVVCQAQPSAPLSRALARLGLPSSDVLVGRFIFGGMRAGSGGRKTISGLNFRLNKGVETFVSFLTK